MRARLVSIESVYPVGDGFEREGLLCRNDGSTGIRLTVYLRKKQFRVGMIGSIVERSIVGDGYHVRSIGIMSSLKV
jgi:hypothetical protein